MKKIILIISILFFGCTTTHTVLDGGTNAKGIKLSHEATVYMSLPEDNTSNEYLYVDSGKDFATELEIILNEYFSDVRVSDSVETCDQGLENAKSNDFNYHICPRLLQYEDYSTGWNGIPDKIKLEITLTEANTDELVDKFLMKGEGKVVTFGGDHPFDIAREPLTKWIKSLF